MRLLKHIFTVAVILSIAGNSVQAGNPDRAGESGAYELLMNGWARSAGLFGMNSATVKGVEALRSNVGGLALASKTEVVFSYSLWMQGSDVDIAKAGFAQRFGEENVIGLSIMSLNFGEIERTTTAAPEGGLGTFKPTFLNIGLGYARKFSNSIHGGFTFRVVNERIEDIAGFGMALDAGIQYVTGPKDNIHFGVAIRNLGTPMKFNGDGLVFKGIEPGGGDYTMSQQQRGEKFELPSLLNIGAAYDFYFGPTSGVEEGEEPESDAKNDLRLTIVANFTSNSVGKDHVGGGAEFAFKEMFMVRAGYRWEEGITKEETRTTVHTGFAGGVSIEVPVKDGGPRIGIDYSFRSTSPFKGTHSIGARFLL